MKKGIRFLCFGCIAAFLLYMANCILCVKSPHGVDQARNLYRQPRNKIDVLFLGSSHVHCNVDPQILWDEHGMASYLLTSAEQPLWNSYHYLVEALKTQKPQLVVLDMYCPARFMEDYQENWWDENLDGMRFSLNKMRAVDASVDVGKWEYLIGYPKYHDRYDTLSGADFENFFWNRSEAARWKGYTPLITHAQLTEPDHSHVTQEQEMTEKSQLYFQKILELTREEGISLALVSAPYLPEESDTQVYNYIERIVKEEGLLFLNYNTTEMYREAGIDFAADFADHTHLNEQGSQKYTAHLGKWLAQNYEVSDRRGRKGYESWADEIFIEEETAP